MTANDVPELPIHSDAASHVEAPRTRPFYWSVRRELWENRSITLAPLAVAGLVFFGSLAGIARIARKVDEYSSLDSAIWLLAKPLSIAPAPIMLATFIIGVFFALDALYGERRDRSILFWKSLPVSDRTAVLAKAAIPLAVLPSIAFLLSAVTQILLLMASILILPANGLSPFTLLAGFRFFEGLPIMIYGLAVHTLWFAPIYGWLLLISAWARRAPVLWAVIPPLGIAVVERMAGGTTNFAMWLQYRVTGAMKEAFSVEASDGNVERIWQLEPLNFLSTPGLWIGLAFAAIFIAGAVHLRRSREPT
ncbi:MAG: ABC transporter permease [Thermoanaerobaculia bacterium]